MKETLIKRFFAGVLALIMLLSVTAVASAQTTEYFGRDGLAVPGDANIERAMSSESAEPVRLVPVASENSLMTVLGRSYVRENREGVDLSFPIWTNDCGALRFLGDELWLVTNELELLASYDGLYISEGRTFTEEYGQADPDEFIFVRINDNLYMNAQSATLVTLLGEYPIQPNSVLRMTSDSMSWFSPDGECLVFDRNTTLFDAKLRIGENEYDYHDLLKALGLINEATAKLDKGQNADDEINEAMDILGIEKEYKKKTDTRGNKLGEIEENKAKEVEAQSELGEDEAEEVTEDTAAEGAGGEESSESGSGEGGVAPEESLPPEPEESPKGTPTPTPKPSPSEQPTEEPSPTVLPSGTPSPSPSTPATNTPSPSETPEETPTPKPTDTGEPTTKPTKLPGPTPSTTPTLKPSIIPGPTNTVEPTHSAVPTAETSDTPAPSGSIGPSDSPDPEESEEPETPEPTKTPKPTAKPSQTPTVTGSATPAPTPTGPTPVPTKPPYIMPTVYLKDLMEWTYSVNGKLVVTDTQNNIVGKIRVTAYRKLNDGNPTQEYFDGHRIWTAKKGLSSVGGRKSVSGNGTSEFTLATLPPETTLYLQYTYTYNEVTEVSGERQSIRRTMNSPFYEFTTLSCNTANVKYALADWNIDFAAATDGIVLRNFTLKNSSNYDPEDESYSNFKKNTLPYITKIQLTAQKRVDDTQKDKSASIGSPVTINIGTSALNKAKEGASVFASTAPKLDPNSYYTFTVKAMDKFGNIVPLLVNSNDSEDANYFEDFYTAKAAPTVSFTEVKNVADKYTVRVTVNDPNGALLKDDDGTVHDLRFTAATPDGIIAQLNGTWKDDTPINPDKDHPITEMILTAPANGKSYEFTLDSLAFAQTYYLYVNGDYSRQPDPAMSVNTQLEALYGVEFGKSRIYTASLSSGNVGFLTSFPVDSVKDTYLTIESTMNELTTTNILPLVDQFKYVVTNTDRTEAFSYIFDMDELNVPCSNYPYDAENRYIVIQEGDTDTPRITISGSENDFIGKTVWEVIMATSYYDEGKAKDIYTNGATVRMTIPKDTLVSKTNYNFSIVPIVQKSGRDYTIPSVLTGTSFTTRRIQPVAQYSDFIVASGNAVYKDFKIYDPDTTIRADGLVYAKLIYNGSKQTTINVQTVYANDTPKDLTFSGLIEGASYTVQFVAATFNDTELNAYITNNKLLFDPDNFLGNEDLNGSINITSLDLTDRINAADVIWSVSGPEALNRINQTDAGEITDPVKKWGTDAGYITTEYIEIPSDVNFIEYGGAYPASNVSTTLRIYFYNSNRTYIDWYSTYYSNTRLIPVPENAAYCKIYIPHTKTALQNEGVVLLGYKQAKENIFTSTNFSQYILAGKTVTTNGVLIDDSSVNSCVYMLPVKEGDVFTRSGGSNVYTYNSDGTYKGTFGNSAYYRMTIPKGVHYISYGGVATAAATLYKVFDAATATTHGYTASFDVAVNDVGGKLSDNPTATLSLYASDTMRITDYGTTPIKTVDMNLVKDSTDPKGKKLVLDPDASKQILSGLNANNGFKLVLTVQYNGQNVILDTCEFRTDSACQIIHNNDEMNKAITANPYANLIVVSDFEHNISCTQTFYGTIDFQGHVITRKVGFNGYLIYSIGLGGSVTNLVYDIPADATLSTQMFYNNSGLIENVILRTKGAVTSNNYVFVQYNWQPGTVRNVIFQLGGDLTSKTHTLTYINYGVLENMIIYGVNRAGIIMAYNTGFISQWQTGTLRHIYSVVDMWQVPNDAGSYSGGYFYSSSYFYGIDALDGFYAVGDYYKMPSGVKNYLSPMSTLYAINATKGDNVYYIANRTYTKVSTASVNKAEYSQLTDRSWQDAVLGDGFDTSVVTLDSPFYPRLIMPDCMMIHQEYLPISDPTLAETPKLVDDAVETGRQSTDEEAWLRLSFENKSKLPISSVTITGLDVQINSETGDYEIENLGVQKDGLYDVLVHVKVSATKPQYLSKYTVTEYTWVNGSKTGKTDKGYTYTTDSIEFWKEIVDQDGWADINKNMGWNYKLMNDITFPIGYAMQQVSINGSTTSFSATKDFTGKLDGNHKTLRGIHMDSAGYPFVFYRINGSSAYIKDLFVDGMTLSNFEDGGQSTSYAGFVRYVIRGSTLDNIHISNSSLTANGHMGLLVGFMEGASSLIKNCSVTESTIDDRGEKNVINCGGIVGTFTTSNIVNSYVSGIQITCNRSSTIINVGGIAGRGTGIVENCYVQGTIDAAAQHVGGISAENYVNAMSFLDRGNYRNWTYVTLFNQSGVTGGIVALRDNVLKNCIAMGDVYGVSGSAHRISGVGAKGQQCCAYDGQIVTGIEKGKLDDAAMLLSKDEFKSASTWVDVVDMGPYYDYSCLDNNYCPKLYSTEGVLLPNQKDIYLPGESMDPRVEVTAAQYDSTEGSEAFTIGIRLTHPGVDSDDITAMFDNNKPDGLNFTIDGLDISEAQITSGNVNITVGKGSEKDSKGRTVETLAVINIKRIDDTTLLRMKDSYTVTVKYPSGGTEPLSANAVVDFGVPLYWEITDLTRWNSVLAAGHGKTNENFLIKGTVDFRNTAPQYTGLKINRLEGDGLDGNSKPIYGFANMTYAPTGDDAEPWILSVSAQILKLRFENFNIDYAVPFVTTATSETPGLWVTWDKAGVISNANGVQDCVIDVFNYTCSAPSAAEYSDDRTSRSEVKCNTSNYGGFFGAVYGNIKNLDISNATILARTGGSYIGAIAGYQTGGSLVNVNARTISVTALSGGSYICGLLGTNGSNMLNSVSQNAVVDIDGITVHTKSSTAGVVYSLYNPKKLTLKNFSITSDTGDAYGYSATYPYSLSNTYIDTGSIIGNNAAGIANNSYGSNNVVRNATITARTGKAAGLAIECPGGISNSVVENCIITAGTSGKTSKAAGFVCDGYNNSWSYTACKIINTTITSYGNAGAIMAGPASNTNYTYTFDRCYVGSDVTVTSINGAAGGLAGKVKAVNVSNCICGATVISENHRAGGLIGEVEIGTYENLPIFQITNSAFNGKVSSKTHAAGLIGYVDTAEQRPTVDTFKGDVVAGEISGNIASLWINNINNAAAAGDAVIAFNAATLVNGSTPDGIRETEKASSAGTAHNAFPEHGTIVTNAADFNTDSFYKSLGWTTSYWSFAHLGEGNTKMPYTKYSSTVLGPNGTSDVPLPVGVSTFDDTAVYVSGADSINIETTPNTDVSYTIKKNGAETSHTCRTNDYGVITLNFDFMDADSITVKGTTYTGAQLRRTVMTYIDQWYFIDTSGNLHTDYENQTHEEDARNVILTNVVNIWRGQALCSDGKLYDVSDIITAVELTRETANADMCLSARPLYSYKAKNIPGGDADVDVYYFRTAFNRAGGVTIYNYRILKAGSKFRSIEPIQNVYADGAVFKYFKGISNEVNYYALLTGDGVFRNYGDTMALGKLTPSGILEISNNFDYDGTVLMAQYSDGVVAVDYTSGTTRVNTRPELSTMLGFAKNMLRSVFASNRSGSDNAVLGNGTTDGAINGSAVPQLGSVAPASTDGTYNGDGTANGNGTNNVNGSKDTNGTASANGSQNVKDNDKASAGEGGKGNDGTGDGGATTAAVPVKVANTAVDGKKAEGLLGALGAIGEAANGSTEGKNPVVASPAPSAAPAATSTPAPAESAAPTTSPEPDNGTADGNGKADKSKTDAKDKKEEEDEVSLDKGLWYVPNEGITNDGELVVPENENMTFDYVPGDGVYVEGDLCFVEDEERIASGIALASGMTANAVPALDNLEAAGMELLVYDAASDKYVPGTVEGKVREITGVNEDGSPKLAPEAEPETIVEDSTVKEPDAKLNVNHGFGRSLTTTDRGGVTLLLIVIGAFLVIVAFYLVKRKD